jgi:transcriptional regulator with XRE-family HTH domain
MIGKRDSAGSVLQKNCKKLSQSDLGKAVGTSGDIIGRYERDEVKPSIEVAIKIADALQVSLDYLVGKTSLEVD